MMREIDVMRGIIGVDTNLRDIKCIEYTKMDFMVSKI